MSQQNTAYQASIGLEMILSEFHQAEKERKEGIISTQRAETLISFFRILSSEAEKQLR